MSSQAKVQECTRRARSAFSADEKLNAITDAVHEFVDYFEQIEHLLRTVETRIRRLE